MVLLCDYHFSLIRAKCWGWARAPWERELWEMMDGSARVSRGWGRAVLLWKALRKISRAVGFVVLEGARNADEGEQSRNCAVCQRQSSELWQPGRPRPLQPHSVTAPSSGRWFLVFLKRKNIFRLFWYLFGIGSIKNLADYFGRGRQIIQNLKRVVLHCLSKKRFLLTTKPPF